ncbi:MAG: crossover junction endodeoxyribonuclease RuvC, partial [Alphaproteobacteria bacterium]|nr:crossover junction endodeoxyribonuclease RuvC [Alphaproteobacteria bacterium]
MEKVRIIGLDPGLRHTGWGIVETKGNSLTPVASGVIDPPTDLDLAQRLSHLYQELS